MKNGPPVLSRLSGGLGKSRRLCNGISVADLPLFRKRVRVAFSNLWNQFWFSCSPIPSKWKRRKSLLACWKRRCRRMRDHSPGIQRHMTNNVTRAMTASVERLICGMMKVILCWYCFWMEDQSVNRKSIYGTWVSFICMHQRSSVQQCWTWRHDTWYGRNYTAGKAQLSCQLEKIKVW